MFFTQSHFNRPEGVDDVSKLTKEVMVQRLEQFIGTQGEANSLEHLKMGLLPQEELVFGIPSIHLQVLLLLVEKGVYFFLK